MVFVQVLEFLTNIKTVIGTKTDTALAAALGVKHNTVASWKTRDSISAVIATLVSAGLDLQITLNNVPIYPLSLIPQNYNALIDSIRAASLRDISHKGDPGVLNAVLHVFDSLTNEANKAELLHSWADFKPSFWKRSGASKKERDEAADLINKADDEVIAYAIKNKMDFIKQLKKIRAAHKVLLGG